MHTIQDSTSIKTTPARALEALSTKEGFKGWWTTDCDCDAEKQTATFRFEKQGSGLLEATFRLDSKDAQRIAMTCVSHTNKGDWLGTKLVFTLTPDGDTTRVDLVHSGYPAKNDVYAACVKGWTFFLGSLKSYIETGKGEPHVRASHAA
jgi:uncharacterized protein YndB with AHSA1/START domain